MKKYFSVWWIPVVFNLIPITMYILGHIFESMDVIAYSLKLFLINLLVTTVSATVQILLKRWYFAIPQTFISLVLLYYATNYFSYSELKFFSTKYNIPQDTKCEELSRIEIKGSELEPNNFKLEGCCGYHTYYTLFYPSEKGYLFIKAFYIDTNERLSEEYINYWSKVYVDNLNEHFFSKTFTIYEGMGDRYCARIELWFQPNKEKEYMVNKKNYMVEGKD